MLAPYSADLSPSKSNYSFGYTLAKSSSLFLYNARNSMDLDHLGHGAPQRQRRRPARSNSSPQTLEFDYRGLPQRYSSPLPQTEWRQSRERRRGQQQQSTAYRSTSTHNVYPAHSHFGDQSVRSSPISTGRSYRRRIRDLLLGSGEGSTSRRVPSDPSRLYPQINPYDERSSVYSAPDEMEHYGIRSRSPDSSTGYMVLSSLDDPSPVHYSRAAPYWPAVPYPRSNVTTFNDHALADAADFHLFVEATAGLGMQDAFTRSTSDLSDRLHRIPRRPLPTRNTEPVRYVSPIEESTMTITAMQQLAQMPLGQQQPVPNINLPLSPAEEISPLEEEEDFDDELPGYAESQAQAQAHLREAAARRAQELQRRWRLSGANRGV